MSYYENLTLPDWEFVGGSSQGRSFTLVSQNGQNFDLPGAVASLSIVSYVNPDSKPALTKQVDVEPGEDGEHCEVAIQLSPAETQQLIGRYVYQLSIKDANGNIAIPQHGKMVVTRNLDQAFLL